MQNHTKAEGRISEIHIGLGGTMSTLFLRQLSQKTHRGLEGRVRAGKSAGGISYMATGWIASFSLMAR